MEQLFFFGSLRDRDLLEVVLGRAVADADLRAGHVHDYATLRLVDEAYPHLAPHPGGRADGVVVSGVDAQDLARLCYFEEAEYGLAPIRVETVDGPVDAQYFRATGKAALTDGPWDFDAWLRADREVAVEAARELMAHVDLTPVEEMDKIWTGIMIRARIRTRARAETLVTGDLRGRWSRDDIEIVELERPYTSYFAIEDYRLRHRQFDGSWSAEIQRTAFTSGDAVTVLPYDPRTDEVLLIEQFRTAVMARGDSCAWVIEVIAGRLDQEQDPEPCARREALEEAGLVLGRMEVISGYYPAPGFAAEYVTSYVGEADLSGVGGIHGAADEGEDIRAFTVSVDKALQAVSRGEINTSPVILSLFWLAVHRDRLRALWAVST